MKDTFYFSHDYDSRQDEKIKKLLYKFNLEGYGIYWALVEMLYQNNGYLQVECERIAFELRTESDKIEAVINDFDLFKIKNNEFYSLSVLHRLKKRKGISLQASKSAKARWDRKRQDDANALRTESEGNAIKESKVKDNKVNKITYPKGFEKVITDWLEYKKEKGQTYKPKGLETFIAMLLKYSNNDPKKADEIIKFSMSNNYAGIFESKNKVSTQNNSDTREINYDTPL